MTGSDNQMDMFSPVIPGMVHGLARGYIKDALQNGKQPAAAELLEEIENKFGWIARLEFRDIIDELKAENDLPMAIQDYLNLTLNDDAISLALRNGLEADKEHHSSIDNLLKKSLLYRSSKEFDEAVRFMACFKQYKPFNNMLVRAQRPGCSFYATEKDWHERFRRYVKFDARPIVILAPMHPVLFVYELDDTEGSPLPEKFEHFSDAKGEWRPEIYDRLIQNAERDLINIEECSLSSSLAGYAQRSFLVKNDCKMRVVIRRELEARSRFAILCHELAHIYLGHLGSDIDSWWPHRTNLDHKTVEIEAETVAYIVTSRLGLETASDQYVASYIDSDSIPETVSVELISKVAGRLEEMTKRTMPERTSRIKVEESE